jgi:hypothetical protein
MEVAARLPGDAITMLWHLATGAPLEPAIVDLALGAKPSYPRPVRRAAQRYLQHAAGVLESVTAEEGAPEVSWIQRDGRWPAPRPVPADAPARCAAVLAARNAGDPLGEQVDSGARSVSVVGDAPLDADIAALSEEWAGLVRIATAD